MPTASINPLLAVEQQLWALVLAWTPLTQATSPRTRPLLLPGNVIRFDQASRWPEAKQVRQAADGIEWKLDIGGSRPDPRAARTLCIQPSVDVVDFNFTLTAGNTQQLTDLTQAEAELRACMKDAGVQLGIPAYVARWEWARRPGKSGKDRQVIITMNVYVKS